MNKLMGCIAVLVSFSFLYAQEVLTNASILKLAKAGLDDEVIVAMITGQPGRYSVDTDAVIALKQAGVSEVVISAMVSKNGPASAPIARSVPEAPAAPAAPAENLVLHDATPVRLRLTRNLSSADSKTGDTIDFEVLEEIKAGDIVVIERGATALGTVTGRRKKENDGTGRQT